MTKQNELKSGIILHKPDEKFPDSDDTIFYFYYPQIPDGNGGIKFGEPILTPYSNFGWRNRLQENRIIAWVNLNEVLFPALKEWLNEIIEKKI